MIDKLLDCHRNRKPVVFDVSKTLSASNACGLWQTVVSFWSYHSVTKTFWWHNRFEKRVSSPASKGPRAEMTTTHHFRSSSTHRVVELLLIDGNTELYGQRSPRVKEERNIHAGKQNYILTQYTKSTYNCRHKRDNKYSTGTCTVGTIALLPKLFVWWGSARLYDHQEKIPFSSIYPGISIFFAFFVDNRLRI